MLVYTVRSWWELLLRNSDTEGNPVSHSNSNYQVKDEIFDNFQLWIFQRAPVKKFWKQYRIMKHLYKILEVVQDYEIPEVIFQNLLVVWKALLPLIYDFVDLYKSYMAYPRKHDYLFWMMRWKVFVSVTDKQQE